MKLLEGKNALITGCNRGIGKAIMTLFAEQGANIIACYRTDSDEIKTLLNELTTNYGTTVYPLSFDLADSEDIKRAMKELKELKIPVDVLVNNAGVPHAGLLGFTRISDLNNVFQINYFAQVQLTQTVSGIMSKTKKGSIINMASVAGMDGDAGNSVYGASKAAMILFTKTLSKELARVGIRVNAIAPTLTDTDFAEKIGAKAKEYVIEKSPAGRLANPEEIAQLALFLASDNSSYINGQVIRIDSGI